MRVVIWNVNGIRACVRHGSVDFVDRSGADIVGFQEVRARPEEIPPATRRPPGWHAAFTVRRATGYSGVGIYSKLQPVQLTPPGSASVFAVAHALGNHEMDLLISLVAQLVVERGRRPMRPTTRARLSRRRWRRWGRLARYPAVRSADCFSSARHGIYESNSSALSVS